MKIHAGNYSDDKTVKEYNNAGGSRRIALQRARFHLCIGWRARVLRVPITLRREPSFVEKRDDESVLITVDPLHD